jgi:hypothetical protein
MKKSLMFFIFLLIISCTSINFPKHPRLLCSKKIACKRHQILEEPIKIEFTRNYNNSEDNYLYEDFPNEDLDNSGSTLLEEFIGGYFYPREGNVSYDGFKEGKFVTEIYDYDTITNQKMSIRLRKIEYFKKGLRDSIFRQFDGNGKIIYETTFNNGTGLWKEFHYNGKQYFEAYTENGYFTDTLKLYNNKEILFEKRLYQKDTLIYVINKGWCLKYKYNPNTENFIEVDSYDIDTINLKQTKFRNTFKYKTKEDYINDSFAKDRLQKM